MPAEIESSGQELRVNSSLDAFTINHDPARSAVTFSRRTLSRVTADDVGRIVARAVSALTTHPTTDLASVPIPDMFSNEGTPQDVTPTTSVLPEPIPDVPSFFVTKQHPYLRKREALKKEVEEWETYGDTNDDEYKKKRIEFDSMLTETEVNVLRVSALGLSVRQVASVFGVTEETTKNHRSAGIGKLGVGSIVPAIMRGLELGLIPEEILPRDHEYWRIHLLSKRERDAYDLLVSSVDNYTSEESLAEDGSFFSKSTVQFHAGNVFRKLGVQGRRGVFLFHIGREMMKRNSDWGKDITFTGLQLKQLELMAFGQTDKEICEQLAIENDEYERNKGLIYDRFQAVSRIEAVMGAIEQGEVVPTFPVDLSTVNNLSRAERDAIIKTFSVSDQEVTQTLRSELGISNERQARSYIQSLKRKLRVKNYIQAAIVVACERGMYSIAASEQSSTLSQREKDILLEIAKGRTNKEIAETLSLDRKTVVASISTILDKCKVQSREQAVSFAIDEEIVQAEDVLTGRTVDFTIHFTPAQREILTCIGGGTGLSNPADVAAKLGKNPITVQKHVDVIRKKLNFAHFTQVIAFAKVLRNRRIVEDILRVGDTRYSLVDYLPSTIR